MIQTSAFRIFIDNIRAKEAAARNLRISVAASLYPAFSKNMTIISSSHIRKSIENTAFCLEIN